MNVPLQSLQQPTFQVLGYSGVTEAKPTTAVESNAMIRLQNETEKLVIDGLRNEPLIVRLLAGFATLGCKLLERRSS